MFSYIYHYLDLIITMTFKIYRMFHLEIKQVRSKLLVYKCGSLDITESNHKAGEWLHEDDSNIEDTNGQQSTITFSLIYLKSKARRNTQSRVQMHPYIS